MNAENEGALTMRAPCIEIRPCEGNRVRIYADGDLVGRVDALGRCTVRVNKAGIKRVRVRTRWQDAPLSKVFRGYVEQVCNQVLAGENPACEFVRINRQ